MTTSKISKIISVWLDETSDPEWTAWVVSRDGRDEHDRVETSDTLKYWRTDEHFDARELAVAYGHAVSEKYRIPLVVEARPRD